MLILAFPYLPALAYFLLHKTGILDLSDRLQSHVTISTKVRFAQAQVATSDFLNISRFVEDLV